MDLTKMERKELPQGAIYIEKSTKEISTGALELNPGASLAKHNRPVKERLEQVEGESVMVLFGDQPSRVTLRKGESMDIPAGLEHIHANESQSKSVTYWRFDGDITEIIEKIRGLK